MEPSCRSELRSPFLWISCITFLAAYAAATWILETFELATPLRVALVLLPVPPFVLLIFAELRLIRRLDELQQRIQLEALAIGFPSAIVLAMAFGFLQREGVMPGELQDLRDVWLLLPWPYFAGLAIARRRYELPLEAVDFAWIGFIVLLPILLFL